MDFIGLNLSGGGQTAVHIGAGAVDSLSAVWSDPWSDAVLIGDRAVLDLYADRVASEAHRRARRVHVLDFPPGEQSKCRETKARLEDVMLEAGVDRQSCVVAIGGGISLDLAGLVAATYMRGISWIAIPTSLLAQVDACVGGKTAVNTRHGKNLIGAFHHPRHVLVDPTLLGTLPPAEWANGLSEAIKHAVIADPALFDWIESHAQDILAPTTSCVHLLRRCLEIKCEVVRQDEREAGRRAILNFGHTAAHAIERASGYRRPHGQAVAAGMRIEAAISRRLCGFPAGDVARLSLLLDKLGLDGAGPLAFERAKPYFARDKKRSDDLVRMSLPASIGRMADPDGTFTVPVACETIREAWDEGLCQHR